MTTQPSLKEQIVVPKQVRPSVLTLKNVPFQIIYHNENHFFGYRKTWIDSYNKVNCSDLEKTIIDCLFNPGYAGGIVDIAKAIYVSKDQFDFKKLFEYIKRFNSQAVIKRMGFLFELLEIKNNIINALQHLKTASYILIDPQLPKKGKMISRRHSAARCQSGMKEPESCSYGIMKYLSSFNLFNSPRLVISLSNSLTALSLESGRALNASL